MKSHVMKMAKSLQACKSAHEAYCAEANLHTGHLVSGLENITALGAANPKVTGLAGRMKKALNAHAQIARAHRDSTDDLHMMLGKAIDNLASTVGLPRSSIAAQAQQTNRNIEHAYGVQIETEAPGEVSPAQLNMKGVSAFDMQKLESSANKQLQKATGKPVKRVPAALRNPFTGSRSY